MANNSGTTTLSAAKKALLMQIYRILSTLLEESRKLREEVSLDDLVRDLKTAMRSIDSVSSPKRSLSTIAENLNTVQERSGPIRQNLNTAQGGNEHFKPFIRGFDTLKKWTNTAADMANFVVTATQRTKGKAALAPTEELNWQFPEPIPDPEPRIFNPEKYKEAKETFNKLIKDPNAKREDVDLAWEAASHEVRFGTVLPFDTFLESGKLHKAYDAWDDKQCDKEINERIARAAAETAAKAAAASPVTEEKKEPTATTPANKGETASKQNAPAATASTEAKKTAPVAAASTEAKKPEPVKTASTETKKTEPVKPAPTKPQKPATASAMSTGSKGTAPVKPASTGPRFSLHKPSTPINPTSAAKSSAVTAVRSTPDRAPQQTMAPPKTSTPTPTKGPS